MEVFMKILITGNRGFVGSETQRLLEESGHEVIGYDLMDGYDIRDKDQLWQKCSSTPKIDRVLHLAAIARFADADKDPKLAFEINVTGTRNVVEVCKDLHIPLVYSSTGSAIMPLNDYEAPYTEDIPSRGNSVYGCTKAIAEYIVRSHTPHIILRYGHIYGKEKRGHGLIGGFWQRIERGLKPQLYGGDQTNDFVYIKDIAQANVLALTASWDKYNQIYNVGSGEELTAEEAGNMVCEVTGWKGGVEKKGVRTVDASRFSFDITKIRTWLEYEPEWNFKKGLKDMFQ
jgi:UDP-glucose 4-epimerase